MPAPNLEFSYSGSKISAVSGFDVITVTFKSDIQYTKFECRATKTGEDYGVGKGELIASFSSTPSGIERTFEIYDDYLLRGDGMYRISLYAQSVDGGWNDNQGFLTIESELLFDSNGLQFLAERGTGEVYNSSHTGQEIDEAVSSVKYKSNKSTIGSYTISASGWENGEYRLSVPGVTATSANEILPELNATEEEISALQSAMIIDAGQSSGEIVLKALGEVPSIDLNVRVIVRGDL